MIRQKKGERKQVETLHRVFALKVIKDWSLAIDGGAHVGTWAKVMAEKFDRVIAYEPTFKTFGYMTENLAGHPNVECRNEALLDSQGWVVIKRPRPKQKKLSLRLKRTKLNLRFVERVPDGDVRCSAIDDLGLDSCGLIKLDLEGAEGLALQGARETILSHRPVLIIEINKHSSRRFGWKPGAVHDYVIQMGYEEVMRENVDRVYVPRGLR